LIATKPANATVDLSRQSVVAVAELAVPTNPGASMTVILEGFSISRSRAYFEIPFGTEPAYVQLHWSLTAREMDRSRA
jgi:hypothetical protein